MSWSHSGPCWTEACQGNRIWRSLPLAPKDSSLRGGFGAAIQGHRDPCFGLSPWVATSQALLAMTKKASAIALEACTMTLQPARQPARPALRRSVAQPGSASVWGTGGRGFESRRSDQIFPAV